MLKIFFLKNTLNLNIIINSIFVKLTAVNLVVYTKPTALSIDKLYKRNEVYND